MHHPTMRGFTLIELMIIVILLSIALGIAIPNFSRLARNSQTEAQAQAMNGLLQFARAEAIVRRTTVTVANTGDTWTVSTGPTPLRREAFDSTNVAIASTASSLTFSSTGSSAAASFIFCHSNDPQFGYLLTVQPSGSTRLHPRGRKSDGKTDLEGCTP